MLDVLCKTLLLLCTTAILYSVPYVCSKNKYHIFPDCHFRRHEMTFPPIEQIHNTLLNFDCTRGEKAPQCVGRVGVYCTVVVTKGTEWVLPLEEWAWRVTPTREIGRGEHTCSWRKGILARLINETS